MFFAVGNFDVRKTVTDAGYVTVGLGVLGFQRAQVRRRELHKRLGETGGCLGASARTANEWAQEIGVTVKERLEPVVGQAVGQIVDQVGMRMHTIIGPGRINPGRSNPGRVDTAA